MRIVDGRQEFWFKKQTLIDTMSPPKVPRPKCTQRHWYHNAEAFGCVA